MKKILYIFAFAASIVACDKNDIEMEEMSSVAIETPAVDAAIDTLDAQDIVLNIINKIAEGSIITPKATRGSAAEASKSSDYVVGHVIVTTDGAFLTLLDESNDDLCFGDTVATPVYLDNSAGDGSEISVEDADGNVSLVIKGNFTALFSSNENSIYKLNEAADNITAVGTFDESNSATITG